MAKDEAVIPIVVSVQADDGDSIAAMASELYIRAAPGVPASSRELVARQCFEAAETFHEVYWAWRRARE